MASFKPTTAILSAVVAALLLACSSPAAAQGDWQVGRATFYG